MNLKKLSPNTSDNSNARHELDGKTSPFLAQNGPQNSKKILLTANLSWNLLNFRRGLIEALSADGHDLVALCPEDEHSHKLERMGCRFVPLRMDNKGISPRNDLALVRRIHGHFRDEMPNAILSYTIKNNIYGAIAANRLGIQFIPNVTGLGTAFLSSGLLRAVATRLYRFAFRPLKNVFFQNHDDAQLFQELGITKPEQVGILPGSGINLAHFQPESMLPQREVVTFLMIARLIRDKGTLEFVEAARMLRQQGVQARFQILGEVDVANRTAIHRDQVTDWVREGVIEYLGTTDDVRPFIADADCIVLPSYREGAPRTLLEAGAMARPCVTTDVPGCRDVVVDGETGLLCKVRDASDLAEKILTVFSMGSEKRGLMGEKGRLRIEQVYDQQRVIDTYYKVLGLRVPGADAPEMTSDTAPVAKHVTSKS